MPTGIRQIKQMTYLGALLCLALGMGLIMVRWDYNVQGLTLVSLALLILGVFVVIPRVAQGEGKLFFQFLLFAFFVKAAASVYRFYWAFSVKRGVSDAVTYVGSGAQIAESLWRWDFSLLAAHMHPGTRFVEGFNGIVFAIIGPTLQGGFLVYAFFTFLGSCLHYRAFRYVFPEGNRFIFAGLLFLYPSWLYWPSSIGKDALQAFLIGLIAYGAARFLRHGHIKGLIFVAIGLWGVVMVRPHIAALLGLALGLALIARPVRMGALSPVVRITMVGVAGVMGWIVINQAAGFVGLQEVSFEATFSSYESRQSEANRGGAAYKPVPITQPLGVPMAFLTVLYRPFPWEAHRGAAFMLSLEGVVLFGLTLWRIGSLKAAVLSARSDPFLVFALVYVVLSILVFSTFGNFSILGRQRLQFLPFFFMLLAYPSAAEARRFRLAKGKKQPPPTPQPIRSPVPVRPSYGNT